MKNTWLQDKECVVWAAIEAAGAAGAALAAGVAALAAGAAAEEAREEQPQKHGWMDGRTDGQPIR